MSDDLHRKLKARAAAAGMSLSEYLLGELRESAPLLTRDRKLAPAAAGGVFVDVI